MKLVTFAFAIGIGLVTSYGMAEERSLFLLERKIPLGEVRGRIDHLAVDLKRGRLFVAELENDTVAVVDLDAHTVMQVISGLKKPQGLGYHPPTDTLYVANGGDGTAAIFVGDGYREIARISLGDDADNVRVDETANQVFVSYGDGALAIIDPISRTKIADIKLKAHPESYQLHQSTNRIIVNDPANQSIVVIDRGAGKEVNSWPTGNGSNFPMALNNAAGHVVVAFRNPAKLGAFSMRDAAQVANLDLCADVDDMFVDASRQRVYVSCGEGFLDIFDASENGYRRIGHVATIPGARTSLFVPEWDQLFIAARATSTEPAAIWVFRPNFVSGESIP
jgi:DNA-binding beta-propeller fold protein YncE